MNKIFRILGGYQEIHNEVVGLIELANEETDTKAQALNSFIVIGLHSSIESLLISSIATISRTILS